MRKLELFKTLSLAAAASLLVNCSARDIVQESNPYLDPKPVTEPSSKRGVDPMEKDQWNLTKIASTVATSQEGSKRIKVALLSTGVDYTHEDLVQNVWLNRAEWRDLTPGALSPLDRVDDDKNGYNDDFVGYDFVENDGLPYDRNGAGTAMAGVLAAATNNGTGIRGIVSDVSLVPVKFVDPNGHVLLPNLFKALKYALDMKVDVILLHTPSYEFGSTAPNPRLKPMLEKMEKEMLDQAMTKINQAGIPVIASAGNNGAYVEGSESLTVRLGRFSNVLVVTSVDQADVRPFIANFSRERVHTSAPGKDVLTTAPGNKYARVSSTGLAAAQVAGALALAINQTFGRVEGAKLLEGLLKPEASDAVERLKFETIGGNRLNVTKYLSYLGTK